MSLPSGYLLLILGLTTLLLYALTWRNRLIRDPVTGHTRAWWITAEAKTLIDQLGLNTGHMPELPRWPGPVPRRGMLVVRIEPPAGIADAIRYSLHLERRTGRYWLKQRGGVLGGPIVFGPGSVDIGKVFR
jgi:hypothetical protein